MKLKVKNWLWNLSWPFAKSNYTTIGDTLYYPKGEPPSTDIVRHETIHAEQFKKHGTFKFLFRYLLLFPIIKNKFRWDMEYEAYTKGSGLSDTETREILSSMAYGWLR